MTTYPLTTPQQNIWNLQKYYPNTAISNICGAVFYNDDRDVTLLKTALNAVLRSQTALRLRFTEENGEPGQTVSDYHYEDIPVRTFSTWSEYDTFAKAQAQTLIALTGDKMYRFQICVVENRVGVLVTLSHLIADAWSFSLIIDQVEEAYRNLRQGAETELAQRDYIEYVLAGQDYTCSERYVKDAAFFREHYQEKPERTAVKPENGQSQVIHAGRLIQRLPETLAEKITRYSEMHSITTAVLFEAAVILYLSRMNPANQHITIGLPVLNRSNKNEKKTCGMFISTMPFTVEVTGQENVAAFLEKIVMGKREFFRHQKYPYAEILKQVREKHGGEGNLYDVMVSVQNARMDDQINADTYWYSNGSSEIPLTIHIDNRDGKESPIMTVDYQQALFPQRAEAELFTQRLLFLLEQMVTNDAGTLQSISLIPDTEKNLLLKKFNDTQAEYAKDKCVHELFAEQVGKTPEKQALIFEDKQFTYRELDKMSNSLAHYLREKGIERGDIVPIIAKRSWHIIVAMLGVLKAGGAYMPVSPDYPAERIRTMLEIAGSKIVLCYGYDGERFDIPCADLEQFDFKKNTGVVENWNKVEDLCYIIFTSGSTGTPKGVSVCHCNVVNYVHNNNNNVVHRIIHEEYQRIVSVTNIIFDIFVTESLLPLVNGMTIYLANDSETVSQTKLAELINSQQIEVLQTTPTKMRSYLLDKAQTTYLKKLKAIILGGEALPQELYVELSSLTTAEIFNIYGPAETTVWSTNARVTNADDITIGRPIANTQIYILDESGQLLPVGVAGELCIAGDGVGKGYLNQPELTAERFIPNPFSTEENGHGAVLYRTGDLARWRADGEIEYLGRIDTQVKIRGLRIELGEIESVMSSFAGIGLTAVAAQKDEHGRQYLVGYYTSEQLIEEKALRAHLLGKLPKYMVPNYFMRLETLPMTPSGKTDRKNLPLPDFTVRTEEYVAPETREEQKLCQLMAEALSVEQVGVTDDFFALGGDSLSAITFVAKAQDAGIELGLQTVFDYPTVRALCGWLLKHNATKDKTLKPAHLADICFDLKTDDSQYAELLKGNAIDEDCVFGKKTLGNVFLTGVTGFLGAHVLDELMKQEIGRIYCLVRSEKEDDRRGRLVQTLRYYFGDLYETEIGNRIIPVVGNIEREELADHLPADVQTVIHVAATVKHYGAYSYFRKVNVEGTRHVADYAKQIGATLIHISTISVSGNSLVDAFDVYRSDQELHFSEQDFYIGQPLDNVYVRSKFEAEKLILDRVKAGELSAKIIRVGNLTNRERDFRFQPNFENNAFLKRMKAVLALKQLPDYLMPLYSEFSPVDLTAEGIVKIAEYAGAKQTVFHLYSNKPLYFDRMLEIFAEQGIDIKVVGGQEFYETVRATMKQPGREFIYETLQGDMDRNGRLLYDSNIHIENAFTVWFMRKVGFEWNEIDERYVKGYLEYFRELGYLE